MNDDKKTVAEWEEAKGMLITIPLGEEITYSHDKGDGSMELVQSKFTLDEQLTSDEFFEKFYAPTTRSRVLSVNHADRKQWLTENDYEPSRENMLRKRLLSKATWEAAANRNK
jgi:hypothetical protein